MYLNSRFFITIAALSGFMVTCLGAFGAHALKSILPLDMINIYQTGITYQFYHTLALLLTGLMMVNFNNRSLKFSGVMFVVGIVIFSGSLYMLALTGIKQLGIITPVGGIAFLMGWLSLAVGINKKHTR
ncbi:MAG: DUF423 domain-containing protein [Gammaproteobacteria bacterium]